MYRLTFIVFTSLLLVINASAQQVIPFSVASSDPKAKYTFSDWSVMGKFEGTIEISTVGSKRLLKIKMTGGELLAPKSPKTVIGIAPFLARRGGKTFDRAVIASPLQLRQSLHPGVPQRLGAHEFLIEIDATRDLSKHWLGFETNISCEYLQCTTYAHSPSNIFAKF